VSVSVVRIGADDTAYPYLLFLSQAETGRILGDHLPNHDVEIERGVELRELSQAGGRVSCRLRHQDGREEFIRAGYVVGCDGAHSTVRAQAGIAFEGMAYPQTLVLADVEATGVEPGAAHAFMAARGILLFFPLGSPATWRLLAMRPCTDSTPVDRPVTLGEVQALVDAYTATPVRLSDQVDDELPAARSARHPLPLRACLPGRRRRTHPQPSGRPRHEHRHPGRRKPRLEARARHAGRAGPALLETYEQERAPVGRRVLRFTDRAFTAGISTNPLVRFVRVQIVPRLLPLAARPRPARSLGFRTRSQLAVCYRRSRLPVDGPNPPRHGPKPGDRLPDAPVTERGKQGTLHGATSGTGFHVLLCGPAANWPETATRADACYAGLITVHRLSRDDIPGVLHDHTGEASHRLGLRSSTQVHYLVRPDGHIAHRGGDNDFTGLHAYLERQLSTTS
jgi:2-polyprenyl-6-methoxyphenol hydroxylase-like FAD-dependent oxidoreductase